MGEREPQSERLNRGELLCLYHPGTNDTFSGYGLIMADLARAEAAKKRAEERIAVHPRPDIDFERARIALMKSLIRLQVASRARTRA